MGGAVEMCSGLGACRKTLEGTMCPSYMATREEKHSTRGRANALRLAMTGRLGEAGLGDDGVHEVLDLCLECRACKAECPVGVDMARFKSEFLAGYWQRHGTPLRTRVLGHVAPAREGRQRVRAAVEPRRRQRARPLDQRAAARHRSPPNAAGLRAHDTFARRASTSRHDAHQPSATSAASSCSPTRSRTINEPEIGVAAADVLDAAGVGVRARRRTAAAAGR